MTYTYGWPDVPDRVQQPEDVAHWRDDLDDEPFDDLDDEEE